MSLTDGYEALDSNINKVGEIEDNSLNLLPELTLSMTDDELLKLSQDWQKTWRPYAQKIEALQQENESYWLGKQFNPGGEKRPTVDNLLFEALETFLPIATRPKADPQVESDNSEEGNALADKVRKMISYIADRVKYNLKMKQVARYWALYLLGVVKVGWSMKEDDITCVAVRPQKIILDPTATIEECEYNGYYIGEVMEDLASDLVIRFPNKKDIIKEKTRDKMGTKVKYVMWSTDEYTFWTFDDKYVLGKIKNPHWNYTDTTTTKVDDYGQQVQSVTPARNHFKQPKKPYVFLSVFNLGKQPHDETNLIQQSIPLQDLINKRLSQIDKNLDSANGGLIVSGDAFTEEQGAQAAQALRKGGTIWVPTGDVNQAIKRDSGVPLPQAGYESLMDYRNEARNIFGTRGSSPQGSINEQTVGGKRIIQGQDSDRIGGGISTYLEQFSDNVFNWFVQLMYVYYDEPHSASVLGKERAQEYITLQSSDMTSALVIGVKEGSMIPHDPASQRGEALELWRTNGIDPISFFEKLEFPNPRESAKNLYLWQSDPVQLFPELAQQAAAKQQQEMQQAQMMEQQKAQQEQQAQEQQAKQTQSHEMSKIALEALVKPEIKKPTGTT
jgi:hypothetical protein